MTAGEQCPRSSTQPERTKQDGYVGLGWCDSCPGWVKLTTAGRLRVHGKKVRTKAAPAKATKRTPKKAGK